jgi:hypothetical protein
LVNTAILFTPSSFATTGKRGIELQLAEKRQIISPLVGGTSVALDVTNPCGQPVNGLSPSPGVRTLRLLFSCDLLSGQYLGTDYSNYGCWGYLADS